MTRKERQAATALERSRENNAHVSTRSRQGRFAPLTRIERDRRTTRNERRGRTSAWRQAKKWAQKKVVRKPWSLNKIVEEDQKRELAKLRARLGVDQPVHPQSEEGKKRRKRRGKGRTDTRHR